MLRASQFSSATLQWLWDHSPTSSPGSRLCQDSPLRGCIFQHLSPGLHNKWKTPTASPRLFFPLGCGAWPCQCLGKQFLPFLCYSADCQKGSRVRISMRPYLKGAGKLCCLFEQLNHRHPQPSSRSRGKEENSVGHREQLLAAPSLAHSK